MNHQVIGQKELTTFRDAVGELKQDPYSFVVKQNKLPMSLITDAKGSVRHTFALSPPIPLTTPALA